MDSWLHFDVGKYSLVSLNIYYFNYHHAIYLNINFYTTFINKNPKMRILCLRVSSLKLAQNVHFIINCLISAWIHVIVTIWEATKASPFSLFFFFLFQSCNKKNETLMQIGGVDSRLIVILYLIRICGIIHLLYVYVKYHLINERPTAKKKKLPYTYMYSVFGIYTLSIFIYIFLHDHV